MTRSLEVVNSACIADFCNLSYMRISYSHDPPRGRGTIVWRKMAEGMSSVAIGCHCDDSKDPFPLYWLYYNAWRCEFDFECVLSE